MSRDAARTPRLRSLLVYTAYLLRLLNVTDEIYRFAASRCDIAGMTPHHFCRRLDAPSCA